MTKTIDIVKFKKNLKGKSVITTENIASYYWLKEPDIPKTTINWRIYILVKIGILKRVGKGLFQFGETQNFVPKTNHKMQTVESFLQKRFPFIRYCQWELSQINSFAQHLVNFNVLFVDVERDAVDSVYHALKEKFSNVMAVQNLYDSLNEFNNYIIVRPLVTEAPIQKIEKIHSATLEKMLVDLAVDKEFVSFQGNEIFTIFKSAFEQYTINQTALLRYANRKNKKNEIKKIITINRQ
jgi:hypothetical protein